MSLIYAVIVRGNKVTLVDYESVTSNFPSLAKKLFDKLNKNTRQTYVYQQNYHFHYINEDDFTYLCLSEALVQKATAFAFLEEIKELFCEKFNEQQRKHAVEFGMQKDFVEYLKTKMNYYNNDPENEKISRIQKQLQDVANQMTQTLDQILDREDQIQILVHTTHSMNNFAGNMKKTATEVRQDQEKRAFRTKAFIILVIVAMIGVIWLLY